MAFPQMSYSHCFSNMSTGTQLSPPMPPSMARSSPSGVCGTLPPGPGATSPPTPSAAAAAAAAAIHPAYPHQLGSLFQQLDHPSACPPSSQHHLYAPPPPYSTAAAQNPYFPIGAAPDATSAFYHSLGHTSSYGLKDGRSDSAAAAAAAVCRPPTLTQTPYPYDHAWAHAYHYPSNSYSIGLDGSRRKNATRESTATLKAWLQEHIKNPYPTKGEKIMLAIITKMTLTQVSTWFANARRRLKKENKMTWCPKNKPEDCDDDDADDDEEEGTGTRSHGNHHSVKTTEKSAGGCEGLLSSGGMMVGVEEGKGPSFKKSSTEEVLDQSSGSLDVDLPDVPEVELDPHRAKIWRLAPPCSTTDFSTNHSLAACYPHHAPHHPDPSRRMPSLLSSGLYPPPPHSHHHDLQQAAHNMAAHMHAAMVGDKGVGY